MYWKRSEFWLPMCTPVEKLFTLKSAAPVQFSFWLQISKVDIWHFGWMGRITRRKWSLSHCTVPFINFRLIWSDQINYLSVHGKIKGSCKYNEPYSYILKQSSSLILLSGPQTRNYELPVFQLPSLPNRPDFGGWAAGQVDKWHLWSPGPGPTLDLLSHQGESSDANLLFATKIQPEFSLAACSNCFPCQQLPSSLLLTFPACPLISVPTTLEDLSLPPTNFWGRKHGSQIWTTVLS